MRASHFHDCFSRNHAVFADRFGAEVVSRVSDPETEYRLVRDATAITDASYMHRFGFPEEKGLDFLDSVCAGNVAKVRFGRLLHTFIANEKGELAADCYVANNDERFVLLCESVMDEDAFRKMLMDRGAADAGMEDLSASHALLGIDGFKAWAVVKELFGADVLGLPYLSVERYELEGEPVSLFRAGKTSEFGYYLMTPASGAEMLFDRCLAIARENDGGLCGVDIHNDLRLEGRFFNIYAEGAVVRDPLSLGLQWMMDFGKENVLGGRAIAARRAAGLSKKIIGISAGPDALDLVAGAPVFNGPLKVAEVVTSCYSYQLQERLGLAVFPIDIAFAGLSFSLGSPNGPRVRTISMPPIMPKSLTVKLDEL